MKFCYYLVSIGEPNLGEKLEILVSNLNYIYNDIKTPFDVIINCYETNRYITNFIKNEITDSNCIDNVYIHSKKGVLSELFLTNVYNDKIDNYDYIFFIFDDVKIINIDINEMIRIKNKLSISFFSPKIINATHPWMYSYDNITIHNCIETYLYLFSPADFKKFLSINTIENKWMWGVDLVLGFFNIKSGIINNYTAEHVFAAKDNAIEKGKKIKLMDEYIQSKTPFKSMNEILNIYKPALYRINIDDV